VLYERHCLRCHGEGLDGKGPDAASLSIPPTNFRSHPSRVKDDFDLWFTIRQGRSFSAMHGWSETLADEDIKDIVAYIRSIAPRDRR
jgi:mono/diheme cytochrome c family protein